ncbi:hypothetical protein PTQ19_06620 [Microbacterium esteraromaticum]|uniref:hypothetical protein n=1 Tax=Microbacterium esteraromaticum TaxID=57043 RepID=UPI0015CCEFB2|nr:hypothetical protein [Microbacterium esteraromaticum]WDH80101.1 hypothetical protein PTQ19_06620 [Microbacterium esteraromaticum]
MSITVLTDQGQRSLSTHPPISHGREVLTLPGNEELRRLTLTDRLGLRFALWLLERSLRGNRSPAAGAPDLQYAQLQALNERQAIALLTYGLQRGMY